MSSANRAVAKISLFIFVGLVLVGMSAGLIGRGSRLPAGQAQVPTLTPTIIRGTLVYPPRPLTPTVTPDFTPPVMTLVITGDQVAEDWYRAPITLSFVITDNLTGPGKSWYKFAGDPDWSYYENNFPPVVITQAGVYTLTYYATDLNFNVEAPHTTTIKVMSEGTRRIYLPLMLKLS